MTGLYEDALALIRRRFVGREAELARFRSSLKSDDVGVWWTFGPGGIGKSSLLQMMTGEALAADWDVASVDLGSDADNTTAETLAAINDQLGGRADRALVVLDGVAPNEYIESWLRQDLLPGLPSRSMVAIGSRHAPSSGWRSDPAWSSALELVPLRRLSVDDGQRLLDERGVPPSAQREVLKLGGGNPLALQLLAEMLIARPEEPVPASLEQAPDLVASLLPRLVDDVPDDQHRLAFELVALNRVTTRSLLRYACDEAKAEQLWEWLAGQSWIQHVPGGLCPHDLARDVIVADLRNNDPDRYATSTRFVRNHILEPDRVQADPDRCAIDFVYLHRRTSVLRSAWDWSSFGKADTAAYVPADRGELVRLVAPIYGRASVEVLEHWLARQPQAFTVVRSLDEIVGFTTLLEFEDFDPDDVAADPSLAAVAERAQRRASIRPGEKIGLSRFVCDRNAGSLPPSPTYNVTSLLCVRHWLTTPNLIHDFIVKPRAGSFKPMMDYIDFAEVDEASHLVGDTEMVVFEHDWCETPPSVWLDRMEALEAGGPIVAPTEASVLVALDEEDFASAVRAALRDLARPDRLATNPLLASRVIRDVCDAQGSDAVARVLQDAHAALDDHPRTERARRAVDRTYLRGTITQEAAAEVLDMAFSTYRRHLATGIDLIVDQLWRWELYGRSR